jgi:DNA repair photolyase
MSSQKHIKGRGAQGQVGNRFFELHHEERDDYKEYRFRESEDLQPPKTTYISTFPKSIVNKVKSPDVGMEYSLNPYQGCEHGCVYCYARNSHEFWGYGAGLDFEQKILVKKNAVELLEKKFQTKSWQVAPIVMSGNTDCYQPLERNLQLTRSLLALFLKYKHPVGIITKNSLITRDLDILKELAADNLVKVMLSITSLSEETRRLLEPRTATIKRRLETIEKLSEAGIPVGVMIAPIIPGINSHEIIPLVKSVSERGALQIGHTIVRLNGAIAGVFEDWIRKAMPDKADKVLHQIANCHGGQLNDSQYGRRMKGEGQIAAQINRQFAIAKSKYGVDKKLAPLNCSSFIKSKGGQLSIF